MPSKKESSQAIRDEKLEKIQRAALDILHAYLDWAKSLGMNKQKDTLEIVKHLKLSEQERSSLTYKDNLKILFPSHNVIIKDGWDRHKKIDYSKFVCMIRYIKFILRHKGYEVKTYVDIEIDKDLSVPKVKDRKFDFSKIPPDPDAPTWNLFYYSKPTDEQNIAGYLDHNKSEYYNFNTGTIRITKGQEKEMRGTACLRLDSYEDTEFKTTWQFDADGTVYYDVLRYKRKGKVLRGTNIFPLSLMVFKQKKKSKYNFCIGYYCSASKDKLTPYAGMIIAVRGNVPLTSELKSLIHYLLRHKRLQEEKVHFTYPISVGKNIKEIPENAKLWLTDIMPYAGTYECTLFDPHQATLIRGYLKVMENGTVILFTVNNRQSPSFGVLKKINRDRYKSNLIINLDYYESEYEYRVRIFISTHQFDRSAGNKKLSGVYTCLQYEEGYPFSSLFLAKQMNEDISPKEIRQRLDQESSDSLINFGENSEVLLSKEFMHKHEQPMLDDKLIELYKSFTPRQKKLYRNASLFILKSMTLKIPDKLR